MTYEQTAPPVDEHIDEPIHEYVDDDEEWVSAAPKGLRVRAHMGLLLLLLFAVVGLWSGSILQKRHDKSTTASRTATAASSFGAARRSAGQNPTGAASGAAAAGATGGAARGGGTAGIVTDIQGSTIYLTDTTGNLIKITTTPASTIRKTSTGTLADIKLGQTLIVTGAKAADGSTAARAITIAPAGGLVGGGGGGGGGAPSGGGG